MSTDASYEQTAAELIRSPVRPHAPLQTDSFRSSRPSIVGPDEPAAPFPVVMRGAVQRGFGRGGRELGCLTANLPDESLDPMTSVAKPGIYYGYARVHLEGSDVREEDKLVWPMVMSMGWNPYYKNEKLTAEVHIMHEYKDEFYGVDMSVVVLGYIRPELDYISRGEWDRVIRDRANMAVCRGVDRRHRDGQTCRSQFDGSASVRAT
ncbi:riboflavin kinase [Ceratobasidium sp. 428]|nr:riboflavin kinase [Ceratobasidium sp. 428]